VELEKGRTSWYCELFFELLNVTVINFRALKTNRKKENNNKETLKNVLLARHRTNRSYKINKLTFISSSSLKIFKRGLPHFSLA